LSTYLKSIAGTNLKWLRGEKDRHLSILGAAALSGSKDLSTAAQPHSPSPSPVKNQNVATEKQNFKD
jgi:hypothetical protein